MAYKFEVYHCSECKCTVQKKDEICPHCNASFEPPKKPQPPPKKEGLKKLLFILAVLWTLILVGLILYAIFF